MMRLRSMLFVPGDSDKKFARDWLFFVRVNPFDTGMTFDDMAAVVKPGLDDLLIPLKVCLSPRPMARPILPASPMQSGLVTV